MVTIGELLKAAGLGSRTSRNTLRHWADEDLMPHGRLVRHPDGQGSRCVWDDWVLERVKRIRELKREGHSHAEIRAILRREDPTHHNDLGQESQGKSSPEQATTEDHGATPRAGDAKIIAGEGAAQRRRAREGSARTVAFFRAVEASLVQADVGAKRLAAFRGLDPDRTLKRTLALYNAKLHPGLLFDEFKPEITPDLVLIHRASAFRSSPNLSFHDLVGPLERAFGEDFGDGVKTYPVPRCWSTEVGKSVEYEVVIGGEHGVLVRGEATTPLPTTPAPAKRRSSQRKAPSKPKRPKAKVSRYIDVDELPE